MTAHLTPEAADLAGATAKSRRRATVHQPWHRLAPTPPDSPRTAARHLAAATTRPMTAPLAPEAADHTTASTDQPWDAEPGRHATPPNPTVTPTGAGHHAAATTRLKS